MRETDAEYEAVAGGGLCGQGLAGEHLGMATPGRNNRGAELDRRGVPADDGQSGDGVGTAQLVEPEAVETLLLGLGRQIGNLLQRATEQHLGRGVDADAHGPSLGER